MLELSAFAGAGPISSTFNFKILNMSLSLSGRDRDSAPGPSEFFRRRAARHLTDRMFKFSLRPGPSGSLHWPFSTEADFATQAVSTDSAGRVSSHSQLDPRPFMSRVKLDVFSHFLFILNIPGLDFIIAAFVSVPSSFQN